MESRREEREGRAGEWRRYITGSSEYGTDERKKLTSNQQERVAAQDQTNFTTNSDGLEVKNTARQNSERAKADGDGGRI